MYYQKQILKREEMKMLNESNPPIDVKEEWLYILQRRENENPNIRKSHTFNDPRETRNGNH